jgi:hypothetical protein
MATTTPNFGWAVPTSTDLVKDGAVAIETLGDSIDASLVDLKGGTTGQVLAKASNTNMDFTWVAQDDSNAIQNAIVDAKGDLIGATAADTPARVAVGTNGQVLTADSTAATGLAWATPSSGTSFSPNLCINGAFIINQRSYASGGSLASGAYGLDRWKATTASTSLTFTANANNTQVTISSGGSIEQVIEQQNVPAGTYTLSWSGTATARVYNTGATPPSYAASPVTFTADGLANVEIEFTASGGTRTLSLVKFERGSSATTYSLAGNTFAGELAACQRYYYRNTDALTVAYQATGQSMSTTIVDVVYQVPVTMRTNPTTLETSNMAVYTASGVFSGGTFTLLYANTNSPAIRYTHGSAVFTNGQPAFLLTNSNPNYVGFSAEL